MWRTTVDRGALVLAGAIAILGATSGGAARASESVAEPRVDIVVLNEFLADPPPELAGDANGDGVRNSADDEFVEILNAGSTAVDLSGWTIQDATGVRHEFEEGLTLEAGELYVVFGGGTPTGIPSRSDVASTGALSLNNTSDEVKLVGSDAALRDAHAYGPEGDGDQSIVRIPDATGDWTRPHDAGYSWAFSPGVLNEAPSPVEAESWGKVKSLYRE